MASEQPLTPAEINTLVTRAVEAKANAYAPYSKFRVGAAVLLDDGTIVQGCNVENASYGLCICAERTAYVKAVSAGKRHFRACAIATDMVEGNAWPCGACRQFMCEFGLHTYVISARHHNTPVIIQLKDLLPHAFTPVDLEQPRTTDHARRPSLG